MNIVFVCTGNTCRSPMAEGYLKSKNLPGITVTSAGLAADGISPATKEAVSAAGEVGIDISSHISRKFTYEQADKADKIICMSPSHIAALKSVGINAEKLFLLGEGISDPYGCGQEVYNNTRDEIITAIDGMFTPFSLRDMDNKHILRVAELEKMCFSQPWSAEALEESSLNGTRFIVAQKSGDVAGYLGLNTVLDEGYITNIAVFPEYRRMGAAKLLLAAADEIATQEKLSFISLEVRVSNRAAVSLYKKCGYNTDGVRPGFYSLPNEDAIIMTKRFTDENT